MLLNVSRFLVPLAGPTHTRQNSDRYQQFWTPQEISALTAAPEEQQSRVVDTLQAAGVERVRSLGDSVEATASIEVAARLFGVQFQFYANAETGRRIVRTRDQYTLPSEIASLVQFVTGLSSFPVPHLKTHRGEGPRIGESDDNVGFVPATVFNMYQVPPATPGAPATSQGVYESEAQYFSPTDMSLYATLLNISFPPITPATTVGKNVPSTPGECVVCAHPILLC